MKTTRLVAFVASWPAAVFVSAAQPQSEKQQTINPEYQRAGQSRKFAIEYTGRASEIPAGTTKLRLWIPAPENTGAQKIEQLELSHRQAWS